MKWLLEHWLIQVMRWASIAPFTQVSRLWPILSLLCFTCAIHTHMYPIHPHPHLHPPPSTLHPPTPANGCSPICWTNYKVHWQQLHLCCSVRSLLEALWWSLFSLNLGQLPADWLTIVPPSKSRLMSESAADIGLFIYTEWIMKLLPQC